jgi:hypothetical protein
MSDRLALADAIEDASIERGKAERVASIISTPRCCSPRCTSGRRTADDRRRR